MIEIMAAADPNTAPGWPKLIALLFALGGFWVFVQVHKRVKAVKDGKEINPFSSETGSAPENTNAQLSAPADETGNAPEKGVRKWFRKG